MSMHMLYQIIIYDLLYLLIWGKKMNERQGYTADLAFFRILSKRYHEFAKRTQ